jgi:hypothetical protein
MDIVANSTSFVLLQNLTPKFSSQIWNKNNAIRMKPLPFLVAHYLTCLDTHLGLRLGFCMPQLPIRVRVLDPLESS